MDAELVERAAAGDAQAFTGLVERHGPAVYRVIYRLMGNRSDAEDIVQEAFTRAYRSVNRFRGDSTFLTWLCRIATNRALSRLSLRSLTEEPRPPEQMPHTPSESTEEGACLQRDVAVAMARLPAHLRVTLSLRVHGDLSYAEIAEALNCPIGTVMSRLAEARKLMRVDLVDWLREG